MPITRSGSNQPTVDFTTELFLLKPDQWQLVKASLEHSSESLPSDLQHAVLQLINEVDTNWS